MQLDETYIMDQTNTTENNGECHANLDLYGWCAACNKNHGFERSFNKWTSGNDGIDEFIRATQISARVAFQAAEWIPFEEFTEMEKIGEGGFGCVYKAKWREGSIHSWYRGNWWRDKWITVALKTAGTTEDLLKEAKLTYQCRPHPKRKYDGSDDYKLFGITQNTTTGEYLLALTFAPYGDLRKYIRNKFIKLTWKQRVKDLRHICFHLKQVHSKKVVHADLHTGNILQLKKKSSICDMGVARSIESNSGKVQRFGVIPYVAPEVLRGGAHTMESDVYALGVIMWELAAGRPPFGNRAFDLHLALDICDGLRLERVEGLPDFYHQLMVRCWHHDPAQRPTSKEVYKLIDLWTKLSKRPSYILEQIYLAEEHRKANSAKYNAEESYTTHPLAIYTSKALPDISERYPSTILTSGILPDLDLKRKQVTDEQAEPIKRFKDETKARYATREFDTDVRVPNGIEDEANYRYTTREFDIDVGKGPEI